MADKGNSPPKTAGARSMKTLMEHREYSAPPACVNELRYNLSGWIIVLFVGGFRRLFLYLFISFEFRGVCGQREGGSKIEPYLYTYVAPTKAHAAQIPFFQDIPTGCGPLGAKDRAVYMLGQAGGWLSKVRLRVLGGDRFTLIGRVSCETESRVREPHDGYEKRETDRQRDRQ